MLTAVRGRPRATRVAALPSLVQNRFPCNYVNRFPRAISDVLSKDCVFSRPKSVLSDKRTGLLQINSTTSADSIGRVDNTSQPCSIICVRYFVRRCAKYVSRINNLHGFSVLRRPLLRIITAIIPNAHFHL